MPCTDFTYLYITYIFTFADIPRLGAEEAQHRRLLLSGQGHRLGQGGAGAVGQAGPLQGQWGHP